MKLTRPQINRGSSLILAQLNNKDRMVDFRPVVFKLYQGKRNALKNEFQRLYFLGSFLNA